MLGLDGIVNNTDLYRIKTLAGGNLFFSFYFLLSFAYFLIILLLIINTLSA